MARPMICSLLPPAYDSALSKKFTPASRAAVRQALARLESSWFPNVTQLPNDSTLTFSPQRPKRRYSIVVSVAMSVSCGSRAGAVSARHPAPVDEDRLPGDEGRVVRQQVAIG